MGAGKPLALPLWPCFSLMHHLFSSMCIDGMIIAYSI